MISHFAALPSSPHTISPPQCISQSSVFVYSPLVSYIYNTPSSRPPATPSDIRVLCTLVVPCCVSSFLARSK